MLLLMNLTIGDNENAKLANYTRAFSAFASLANTGTLTDARGNQQSAASRDIAKAIASALEAKNLTLCARHAMKLMPRPVTGESEALNARAAALALLMKQV